MPKFAIGDRVVRRVQIGWPEVRRGAIELVYWSSHKSNTPPPPQYIVLWDDTGESEQGYLDCGLEREPIAIPTFRTTPL